MTMSLIEKIRAKAQANVKKIVLPEGDEPRTVKAAEIIKKEGLAEPVLIGIP
jgi:phosphate acetyltransferase